MKCDACKEKIEENFLNKLKETYIGSDKKKKLVCQNYQKTHSIDELKEKFKI